ncbi:unnamed protein product [Trichogramma brassicae]|uniref:Cytochrome P450 n=1 Tax=Trichogramma brassicae TaxID=86971 RepID=A0A6H5IIR5_9HYME|nr:unnamed protein product [Trichogramma brassicae]
MESWLWTCLLVASFTYIIFKAYKQLTYFSKLDIPSPWEVPFIGSTLYLFIPKRHINEWVQFIYNSHADAKYIGAHGFSTPSVFIKDLDLVKTVLIKNFDHFADRKQFVDEDVDPLFGKNLNFLNGDRWKEVRTMLSPAFTSSKMKTMFQLMDNCAKKFVAQLCTKYTDGTEFDFKDMVGRYTNDVIASCAFGIELDSMKDPDNEFYKQAKAVANFQGVVLLKLMLEGIFPRLTRMMGMRIISKKLTDFFVNIVGSSIKLREEQGIYRPDMLQLMMEARSKSEIEGKAANYDLLEMTAQAFLFFLAGFDATSTQISLIAHELALNPDIQQKVVLEINDALLKTPEGKPTYEMINNQLPYFDAVFSETLRRHPIAFLNRVCSKEFELPPALPGRKPFKIQPGMGIMIPVAAIHSDPKYFENPEKFDPDRFFGKKITAIEATNLGFGMGPRMCIGNRFAIIEIKLFLVRLLNECSLAVSDRTCTASEYEKNIFAPTPKGGFWLKLKSKK